MGVGEFFGDEVFEDPADEGCEGWPHALVNGLPRWATLGVLGFDIGGEVVVTRGAFEAFDTDGGSEVADIDFARGAFVEVRRSSQIEEVTLVEEDASDGEELG